MLALDEEEAHLWPDEAKTYTGSKMATGRFTLLYRSNQREKDNNVPGLNQTVEDSVFAAQYLFTHYPQNTDNCTAAVVYDTRQGNSYYIQDKN